MHEELLTVESPGGPMTAFLAAPDPWPPGPSVVVVQEWWGLNDNIKDICRRLAEEGYAGLAPDLYRGKQTEEPDEAKKLAMELDREAVIEDLKAAVTHLLDECDAVGIMGFCMGGSLTWEMSFRDDRLLAAIPFYGMGDIRGKDLHMPVMAHFAGVDRYPKELLEDVRRRLDQQHYAHQMFIYEGAHHGFLNDRTPEYDEDASLLAWERTIAFLRNELGPPTTAD